MKSLAHRNIPITIIGGGIHGISIAVRLMRDMPQAARHIVILDKHPQPLTEWRNKTQCQGMTFLRSPAVHHITPDSLGIVDYAQQHDRTDALAPPYNQPSTEIFWDYCLEAVKEIQAYPIYHQFNVSKLRWDKGTGRFPFRIISDKKHYGGEGFRSSCVILAIGSEDCVYVPEAYRDWQRRYPNRILHSSQFSVNEYQRLEKTDKIVIVGGGLTAGTLARSLSERGHNVVLVARKQLKTEQFDFPPIWLGPKALTEFAGESDFQRRYQIIQENRGEGSITPDVMESLENSENIRILPQTLIRNINMDKHLIVETTRDVITNVSQIILATGYRFDVRGYGFLQALITQHSIPLVCGLPILDTNLEFLPVKNLFGSGTVAQLQIGPASGNIAGASLAYQRFRDRVLANVPKNYTNGLVGQ